ncbi:hypothetical protein OIU93_07420 [Paeniglutamicibacter sp. ZC-3]|nr:hypothetical protein [Paeniglutamicibacter sp. ZC-3]MCV9994128.1 hypothetical protein [Paeniglutamicibacter sp. ZC-3]
MGQQHQHIGLANGVFAVGQLPGDPVGGLELVTEVETGNACRGRR